VKWSPRVGVTLNAARWNLIRLVNVIREPKQEVFVNRPCCNPVSYIRVEDRTLRE